MGGMPQPNPIQGDPGVVVVAELDVAVGVVCDARERHLRFVREGALAPDSRRERARSDEEKPS